MRKRLENGRNGRRLENGRNGRGPHEFLDGFISIYFDRPRGLRQSQGPIVPGSI